MPTVAEKPSPIANDHHGSETGKPVARLTATPMPRPEEDAEDAADRRQHRRFGEELNEDLRASGAERLADADLARALGDRDHHDRHHADAADHQRDRRDHDQREERGAADLLPDAAGRVLRDDVEVVRLVQLQPVPDAHDLLDLGQGLTRRRRHRAARFR